MNVQKQLMVNLSASIVAFILNIGISFFLTPYIIGSLGIEAYGFVTLGLNFINYATLVTLALNSMAVRFITIEIHRNNWEEANKYFSSVVLANVLIAAVILIPAILCVFYIDIIVNVPIDILSDVRILFAFLFLNFLISIIVSSFSVSTFATNRLYLQSIRGIESYVIQAILLIILFGFLDPKVSYIGIVAMIVLLYKTGFNIYYTKVFLPKIKEKKIYFNVKAVWELVSSGIWNSVIHLGNILLQGLNLLIANLFISAAAMGTLAVANTVPLVLSSLIGTIAGVFVPDFTILYSKRKIEELVVSIKKSMKILGLITNIPIAILIAFGEEFFTLWVPREDAQMMHVLSVLYVSVFIISGSINSLYNVFTVTNKVRTNALVMVSTGIFNILVVLVLLFTTELGIYAVVIVSSFLGIIRNLVFTAPFGAIYLGLKWYTFFFEIIKSFFAFIIVLIIGLVINEIVVVDNWYLLIVVSIFTAILGLCINLWLIFNKDERKTLLEFIETEKIEGTADIQCIFIQ
ncbi:hypothetical protein RhiirA1_479399 [Rhizophagus irregularis]|uniref:Polysaccharide biosynthesis protein C-terminal domain-containing protein n=1 Tax=Rhizophagus irregularis TaxID=588596 RepID=A0A2N0QQR1_9GLOM|nr:hypothetical protein RhiirA1_479399 [Rhizophagus irregularis]